METLIHYCLCFYLYHLTVRLHLRNNTPHSTWFSLGYSNQAGESLLLLILILSKSGNLSYPTWFIMKHTGTAISKTWLSSQWPGCPRIPFRPISSPSTASAMVMWCALVSRLQADHRVPSNEILILLIELMLESPNDRESFERESIQCCNVVVPPSGSYTESPVVRR